jgi:predicted TIM-barrel fold metal-dependent hydrolase
MSRALELSALYDAEIQRLLPAGADIFDAHLHLGLDIDGMVGDYDELESLMAEYGISRAFMFCLDEPDRHPSFAAANDRTLAYAARSGGRLIPFVRLDLNESPIEEAKRCLEAGARGIKLHPRAQRFESTDERLGPVFALAAERGVPILIHGGRGLPPIAKGLEALVEANPGVRLIIAHAGIADLAGLAEAMAGRTGVFFDTSTPNVFDLLDLYRRVPPEQVLYASDYPYGRQPGSLFVTLRSARRAGLGEEQLRGVLAAYANRLADGEELAEPTKPTGAATVEQPLQLARIHQYLSMAVPFVWMREPDLIGVFGLASNACGERNGYEETVGRIDELVCAARDLWATYPEREHDGDRVATLRLTLRLIQLASVEALTSA